jgi:glutamate-1-semialdehyde aminotransferase
VTATQAVVEWLGHNVPPNWPQGSMQHIYVRVRNLGPLIWSSGSAQLVIRLKGQVHSTVQLLHDVPSESEVSFNSPFFLPPLFLKDREEAEISFSLVVRGEDGVEHVQVEPLVVRFEIGPMEQDAAAEALQVAEVACMAFYLPSGRVSRGRDGRLYPLVCSSASGCRIRDVQRNEWIDYVMGWGSALLGYANPQIAEAVRGELSSGAVLSLPSLRELEVAQLLGEMIPCAEATLFGKNGSDVCTAAVRIARVHTGKSKILFSGYSGWQDPFALSFEPLLRQPDQAPTALRFSANRLDQVRQLFEENVRQVAAVILEPAAQVESVDGPINGPDVVFLRELSDLCQRNGALLIFDEIFTGFRHAGGSVQKATGVVPDLACFGKALSAGMPLSVLVGRRDLLKTVGGIFYHPTFKGEAYSFAAAATALKIFQEQDVPAQIENYGQRLSSAVNQLSRRLEVDGALTGPPYRMMYRFNDPDASRRMLLRTLLLQELLKRGLLPFRGCFIPSTAHTETDLQQTIDAFEGALGRVRDVASIDSFDSVLEIPPVI